MDWTNPRPGDWITLGLFYLILIAAFALMVTLLVWRYNA